MFQKAQFFLDHFSACCISPKLRIVFLSPKDEVNRPEGSPASMIYFLFLFNNTAMFLKIYFCCVLLITMCTLEKICVIAMSRPCVIFQWGLVGEGFWAFFTRETSLPQVHCFHMFLFLWKCPRQLWAKRTTDFFNVLTKQFMPIESIDLGKWLFTSGTFKGLYLFMNIFVPFQTFAGG